MGLRDKDKWDPLPKDQLKTKPGVSIIFKIGVFYKA